MSVTNAIHAPVVQLTRPFECVIIACVCNADQPPGWAVAKGEEMIKQAFGVSLLAAAKEKLAVYTQKPVFKAPGEAFDAKACATGKKQLSIPNSSTNPFLKGII